MKMNSNKTIYCPCKVHLCIIIVQELSYLSKGNISQLVINPDIWELQLSDWKTFLVEFSICISEILHIIIMDMTVHIIGTGITTDI